MSQFISTIRKLIESDDDYITMACNYPDNYYGDQVCVPDAKDGVRS
ncbi:hypothetical protein [Thalassotalea mangrovi]|nr:hypothetical protein [Thalassotalea mangrovi]